MFDNNLEAAFPKKQNRNNFHHFCVVVALSWGDPLIKNEYIIFFFSQETSFYSSELCQNPGEFCSVHFEFKDPSIVESMEIPLVSDGHCYLNTYCINQ